MLTLQRFFQFRDPHPVKFDRSKPEMDAVCATNINFNLSCLLTPMLFCVMKMTYILAQIFLCFVEKCMLRKSEACRFTFSGHIFLETWHSLFSDSLHASRKSIVIISAYQSHSSLLDYNIWCVEPTSIKFPNKCCKFLSYVSEF